MANCVYTQMSGGGRESHNVVIYCRARHCGRPTRGRCDGSKEEKLVPPRRFSKGSRKRKVFFFPFPSISKTRFISSLDLLSFAFENTRSRIYLLFIYYLFVCLSRRKFRAGVERTRETSSFEITGGWQDGISTLGQNSSPLY